MERNGNDSARGRMDSSMRVLALQKKTLGTPRENLDRVRQMLKDAVPSADEMDGRNVPDVIVLPEIFTCPYDNSCFPVFAQGEDGEVYRELSQIAREYHAYLVAGSVPELGKDGKIYNTSYVFDPSGCRIARHRKVHLFDIDVPGGQYFKESDVLSPGKPQMFLEMRKMGVRMVFVPAAFNMTTGPAHWKVLFRCRAMDQQIYMLGCAPARDAEGSYVAYGHSILTDPWGRVLAELDEKEGILEATVDLAYTDAVRQQIPLGADL